MLLSRPPSRLLLMLMLLKLQKRPPKRLSRLLLMLAIAQATAVKTATREARLMTTMTKTSIHQTRAVTAKATVKTSNKGKLSKPVHPPAY